MTTSDRASTTEQHHSDQTVPKPLRVALLTLVCAILLYQFFYTSINSGFTRVYGHEYDSSIEAVLVSHWFHVFRFEEWWNQPLYFFPYHDVSGYSETFLFHGILASFFRVFGANVFLSAELSHIVIKAIGFISMAVLLKKLRTHDLVSVVGASLFTLFLNSSVAAKSGQLIATSFYPLLALLILGGIENAILEKRSDAFKSFAAFCLLYAGLLLTTFYVAWFFGIFCIVFVLINFMVNRRYALQVARAVLNMRMYLVAMIAVFSVSLLPFLFVYLPTLKSTGGQSYDAQLSFSPFPTDIINYGPGSYLWGGVLPHIAASVPSVWSMRPGEFQVGFTPDILLLILAALVMAIASRKQVASSISLVFGLTTVVCMILPMNVSGYSPWFIANKIIPGANGIRVIARFFLLVGFPATLLISLFFESLFRRYIYARHLIIGVFMLVVLGQFNMQPSADLNVGRELHVLESVAVPPATCRSFFAINLQPASDIRIDQLYRQNVRAMLIADRFELPTLNGFASFTPSDWVFEESPGYLRKVGEYVEQHGLSDVCAYDIGKNHWTRPADVRFRDQLPQYSLGTMLVMSSATDREIDSVGWSPREPWGMWSDASISSIGFTLGAPVQSDLILEFVSRAFILPNHPQLKVRVFVNKVELESIAYLYPGDAVDGLRRLRIPREVVQQHNGVLTVRFEIENPASPASLGLSVDGRKLGIGLVSVRVVPES